MSFVYRTAVVVFLALSALTAQANVSGLWQGYGSWSYDGSSVPCLLTIRYEENNQVLRRHKGQLQCDLVNLYSDPLTWNKNGTDLILDGQVSGSWGKNGFTTQELGTDSVKVTTQFDATTGKYYELWTRLSDHAVIYEIEATLKRQ